MDNEKSRNGEGKMAAVGERELVALVVGSVEAFTLSVRRRRDYTRGAWPMNAIG